MKTAILFLFLTAAFAQEKAPPIPPQDPISDALRLQIVIAQRDYLVAQLQMSEKGQQIKADLDLAGKLCAPSGKSFDETLLRCVDKK